MSRRCITNKKKRRTVTVRGKHGEEYGMLTNNKIKGDYFKED